MAANPNKFRNATRRASRALILAGLCLAAIGCGSGQPPLARVQGKVLYRGKPLESGAVTFQPDAGPVAVGEIQRDGTFRLLTDAKRDGAVLGRHKVSIVCVQKATAEDTAKDPDAPLYAGKPLIPKKYFNGATSGLNAEVKASNEPFVFELRD